MRTLRISNAVPGVDDLLSMPVEAVAHLVLDDLKEIRQKQPNQISWVDLPAYISSYLFPGSVIDHWIYGGAKKLEVRQVIAEAYGWLVAQGFLAPHPDRENKYCLTRRANDASTSEEFNELRRASSIPWDMIHSDLREHMRRDLINGNYNGAIREAYIRVEVAVREAGNFDHDDVGVKLMRKAFRLDPPGPLTDQYAQQGEKDAIGNFFAGAMGFVKNPREIDWIQLFN